MKVNKKFVIGSFPFRGVEKVRQIISISYINNKDDNIHKSEALKRCDRQTLSCRVSELNLQNKNVKFLTKLYVYLLQNLLNIEFCLKT